MRIRRPERVAAVLLLAALGASLSLLAHPTAAAAASYDLRASVRYGCATDDSDDSDDAARDAGDTDDADDAGDSFVEVSVSADQPGPSDLEGLVLQVGIAGPGSVDSSGVFPEGGPSLVTMGAKTTKVRLAGPVHDGDHVFIRQVGQPDIVTLPLQSSCHRVKPTNFGLQEPGVRVVAQSCGAGSRANLKVTLRNPNEVDRTLQKIGIDQIDYTVLLVRHDGLLAGAEPVGTLVTFDQPSASEVRLSQVVTTPTNYQVRVISLDGAVVNSGNIRLSCAGVGHPGSSPMPSPSVPISSPPSSSRPAPSSPAHTPTGSHRPSSPAPSSAAPGSPAPSSSAPSSPAPTSPAPSSPAPGPASSSAGVPVGLSPSSAGTSESGSAPPSSAAGGAGRTSPPSKSRPSSVATPGPSGASATPSESATVRVVQPRARYGGVSWEFSLVVLVFAAATSVLIGTTVVSARRR